MWSRPTNARPYIDTGWVAEWTKAAVLKTAVRETVPGVRIPPHPFCTSQCFAGYRFSRQFRGFPIRHASLCQSKRLPTASDSASPRTGHFPLPGWRLALWHRPLAASSFVSRGLRGPGRGRNDRRSFGSSACGQCLHCCPASRKQRARGNAPPGPFAGNSASCGTAGAMQSARLGEQYSGHLISGVGFPRCFFA